MSNSPAATPKQGKGSEPIILEYDSSDFPLLVSMVKKLDKELVIFDLETSDLLRSQNFGITEIATMRIKLDGSVRLYCRRLNPERPISPEASAITGITDDDVKNEPLYGEAIGESMAYLARDFMVSGFNIRSFDIPGILKVHERYGLAQPRFLDVVDVRDIWMAVSKGERGKLTDVMEHYGLKADGAHQAFADVVMTAMILNEMIWRHGIDAVLRSRVVDLEAAAHNAVEADVLTDAPKAFSKGLALEMRVTEHLLQPGYRYLGVRKIASELGLSYKDDYEVSRVVSSLVDDERFKPEFFAIRDAQAFLATHLEAVIQEMDCYPGEPEFKLKPLMDALRKVGGHPRSLDYVQIHVALDALNIEPPADRLHLDGGDVAELGDEPPIDVYTREAATDVVLDDVGITDDSVDVMESPLSEVDESHMAPPADAFVQDEEAPPVRSRRSQPDF